jgi:acetylornithine deacetylase
MPVSLAAAVQTRLPEARDLLCDLIAIPSLSGREEEAVRRMARAFDGMGVHAQLRPISPAVKEDPDYSCLEASLDYTDRHNLSVRRAGVPTFAGMTGPGRSVLLQTHLDVVPAGEWEQAFAPQVEEDVVYGRGACDCKGQAATLWLTLAALETAGVRLRGDVLAQFVVEEEIGGNGALAAILDGERADAAVVLEATGLNIHPANRGALWFRITLRGRSVHMGRKQVGVSALEKALPLFTALEAYERKLVAESRGQPLFERYETPVQVNVGMVRAGEWPSMVPGDCVIEGGVGFLPNKPMREVQEDLRALLTGAEDPWIAAHATLEFPKLHNDAYRTDPEHPVVTTLAEACRKSRLPSEVFGWNVSCDARLYALRGGMPTVVFGPGDVSDAHSDHEQIRLSDMARAAGALGRFLMDWCRVA